MTPETFQQLITHTLDRAWELPTSYSGFAASVSRTLVGIAETVARTERITDRQRTAVDNISRAVETRINEVYGANEQTIN